MTSDIPLADELPPSGLSASLEAVRATLDEERPLTLSDVAASAELGLDELTTLFEAAERIRDDASYGETDVRYAESLKPMLAFESADRIARLLRLRLRAMFQIAINDATAITANPAVVQLVEAEVEPGNLGAMIAAVSAELLPAVEVQLAMDYRAALRRILNTEIVRRVSEDVTRPIEMAVGFADLVGFTQLSAATDLAGIDNVLDDFDELAHWSVAAADQVLIAKTIGDAVMLVGSNANEVARALSTIVDPDYKPLDGVPRRAGMSYGEVVVREGDYVGTTVNRAARLTDIARPGSLLMAEDAVSHLDRDRWDLRHLKPMMLKGLGHSRPYRVRPAKEPAKESGRDRGRAGDIDRLQ